MGTLLEQDLMWLRAQNNPTAQELAWEDRVQNLIVRQDKTLVGLMQ